MKRSMFGLLSITIIISFLLSYGCAQAPSTPAPSPTPTPSPAPAPIKLKFASFLLADTATNIVNKWWIDQLEKRTNGRVQVTFIPGGTVMSATEALSVVKSGSVDIGDVSAAYYPNELPFGAMFNGIRLPKSFKDAAEMGNRLVFQESEVFQIFRNEEKSQNMIALYAFGDTPSYIMSKNRVNRLADLKGLKMRTAGSYEPKLVAWLGGAPVTVMPAEWYDGMSKGTFDAIQLPAQYLGTYKLYELSKWISFQTGCLYGFFINMNLDKWNSLPTDIKDIINQLRQDVVPVMLDTITKKENEIFSQMKASGVTFVDMPKDEQAAIHSQWKTIAETEWIPKMSTAGKAKEAQLVLTKWLALLGYK